MAEKKLTGKELIEQALLSQVKFLRNLEKSIEKASVIDEKAISKFSVLVFGREVDLKREFAKRIGFLKLAIKAVEEI